MLKTLFMGVLFYATLAAAGPGPADFSIELPKYRLHPGELAVIVNDDDPLSVQIADYYRQARGIPDANMIHIRFNPARANLDPAKFTALKTAIDRATPDKVQAYALTWTTPYRVGCMSITSAMTFGFDKAWCSARTCAPTRHSPLFGYRGSQPWTDFGIRPSMSIAAASFTDAKKLIDRGIAADNSQPDGTAYLVSTPNKARNVRAFNFPQVEEAIGDWLPTELVTAEGIRDRRDITFYFTGIARVPFLDTLGFLPGAAADHLTSAGGKLTGKKQMSALRWLEAGATGSYGTVVEPCNLLGKFPNPGMMMDAYGGGTSLIEAYWHSVQQPGEGIFVGEPLSAPYAGHSVSLDGNHLRLTTRSLAPGLYRLGYSPNPVGPFTPFPGLLRADYHQTEFRLPKPAKGYYRLLPVPVRQRRTPAAVKNNDPVRPAPSPASQGSS